jgi:hypothetical protein
VELLGLSDSLLSILKNPILAKSSGVAVISLCAYNGGESDMLTESWWNKSEPRRVFDAFTFFNEIEVRFHADASALPTLMSRDRF